MRKIFSAFITAAVCAAAMVSSMNGFSAVSAATSSVYGDLNGDGAVNVLDQIHLKQNVIGV